MSVHNSSAHHHHHHSDPSACHHHQHQHNNNDDRPTPLPHSLQVGGAGGGGRRASRGPAPAPDGAHPPPHAAPAPPPPPPPPVTMVEANGDDAKMDDDGVDHHPGLLLPPHPHPHHRTTTQEVTYIDDEDLGTTGDNDGLDGMLLQTTDRDPFRWNEIVKVKFDDVFGEPDSEIFSFESVWKLSSKVYRTTKVWCYRLLSAVFVIPLVIVWGIVFSCLSFCRVWICVPLLKASDIQLQCLRRLIETLLRTFLAPAFEAVGRCLYHIRLRIIRGDESL